MITIKGESRGRAVFARRKTMLHQDALFFRLAAEDFSRAYRQGLWHRIWSWITHKPTRLLAFEAVVDEFGVADLHEAGMREVALAKIVGSVGRAADFTADFLPRRTADQERWAGVKVALMRMTGLPPVKLYQVGSHYFVLDGHHRISVSRHLRVPTVTAQVTRVETIRPVNLSKSLRNRSELT